MKCDAVSFGFLLLLVLSNEATVTINVHTTRTNRLILEVDHEPHANFK